MGENVIKEINSELLSLCNATYPYNPSEKHTEREATVGTKVAEETEREVAETLPHRTKYLCVKGATAAIFL